MAAYASTTTLDLPRVARLGRDLSMLVGKCDVTNYNQTGAEITDITKYFKAVKRVIADGVSDNGYAVRWNATDKCFHAFNTVRKPLLVVEEVVTCASNVGTLAHVPFYIVAIQATTATTPGAYNIIPTGKTPLTKECAVNLLTGGLTFVSTDVVTVAKVTYIPLQTSGPFIEGNRVIDEEITASATPVALANRACAIQSIYDTTDGNIMTVTDPVGEQPTAAKGCVVDITETVSTKIDFHATDADTKVAVTYIKHTALAASRCIGDGDLALSSEAYHFTSSGKYSGIVVPGLGTQFVGEEASAGNEEGVWEGPAGTAANTVGVWTPALNHVLTNNTNAIVTLSMPWFVIDALEHQPVGGDEVADDVDVGEVNFVALGTWH